MFTDMQNAIAIKQGKCIYNSSKEYKVKIIKWDILYGTGDYEDPEEIREDRNIECYYIFYEDLVREGLFNAGGGSFLTLEEAISNVESKTEVKWL